MNSHLQSALTEINAAHAQSVPPVKNIEKAPHGAQWSGKLPHGTWTLIKHKEDSYTVNTQVN